MHFLSIPRVTASSASPPHHYRPRLAPPSSLFSARDCHPGQELLTYLPGDSAWHGSTLRNKTWLTSQFSISSSLSLFSLGKKEDKMSNRQNHSTVNHLIPKSDGLHLPGDKMARGTFAGPRHGPNGAYRSSEVAATGSRYTNRRCQRQTGSTWRRRRSSPASSPSSGRDYSFSYPIVPSRGRASG